MRHSLPNQWIIRCICVAFVSEGVDLSQVPLRGRGRPARFISELTNMAMVEHQSNSNHSDAPPPVSTASAFTMGPHSILTDPSTILGDSPDDHSLSIAVEMAAVNQAIIALSGQTPINIHSTDKNHQHHHHHHHHNNNNTTTANNNRDHDDHDQSSGQQTPEPQNLSPQQNGTHKSEANNNNHSKGDVVEEKRTHSPPTPAHERSHERSLERSHDRSIDRAHDRSIDRAHD